MHYKMLLWPHANARYQSETVKLATVELELMLARFAPGAQIFADERMGMPGLDIKTGGPLGGDVVLALRRHSLLYGLFEDRDGLLSPEAGRADAALGWDLPAILKYKGKTNELFLQLLINTALYSGAFWQAEGTLALLYPMCGRATGLFVAANYGWDAVGADVDRGDLKEAEQFFRRYLEYHRFKHTVTRLSRTLKRGSGAADAGPDGTAAGKASAGSDPANAMSASGRALRTGARRRHSSSRETGAAPGRVETAPISMISAPSAAILRMRPRACGPSARLGA